MVIASRQRMLTPTRLEWNAIVRHIENDGTASETTSPALAMLKWKVAFTAADPALLPTTERLRAQMANLSMRTESRLSLEESACEMRRLTILPDDLAVRLLCTS